MSAPKSVIKVKKNGVEYTSNVDAAQYYIHELTRAALRDVGKFVKAEFRKSYYANFKRQSGDSPKAVKVKVISSASTTAPRVEIGLPHSHKGKPVKGFYSFFQEFGTSKTKRLGLLTNAVESNIAEIVKIESQYLSGLEDEAQALALIDESEYDDEDE